MDSQPPSTSVDPLHGYYIEDLEIGMTAVYGRTIAEGDVSLFAGFAATTTRCMSTRSSRPGAASKAVSCTARTPRA